MTKIALYFLIGMLIATAAEAYIWPWPEDFNNVKGRTLGDRFISEEEGNSLSRQDLCIDCHDGSVLDNRDVWDPSRFGHRVGMESKQPLPEGIPLFGGKLYCGSCHLPHGGLPGTRTDVKKPFLRYENTNDIFCVACHQERATPGPQIHSRNHSFLKKARKGATTASPKAWKKIQALGGKMGKAGATRCQSCHRPHGAPSRSALITKVDKSQLCSICHNDIKETHGGRNHPLHGKSVWKREKDINTVECLSCHQIHEAKVPGILLPEKGEQFCLHCHKDNHLPEQDRHRNQKLKDRLQKMDEPTGGGICSACHRPHRAKSGFLARQSSNLPNLDTGSALCAGCHAQEDNRLAEKHIGPRFHFLGKWPERSSKVATQQISQALPLLLSNGKFPDKRKGEVGHQMGCPTCHFMHKRPEVIHPDMAAKNLRVSPRNAAICLECHNDRKPMLDTKHNLSKLENAEVKRRFTLKSDNPCSACHAVHGAQTETLYATPYYKTQQTDPQSAVCLDCHGRTGKQQKAEKNIGDLSHPLGPWPTKPENPKELLPLPPEQLPLLPLTVVNAKPDQQTPRGKIYCGTCHQLHQKTIKTLAKTSFLRSPLKEGRTCVPCHRAQRTVAKTKHKIKDPKLLHEIERLFGTIDQTHECTPCHRIHNAKDKGLWFTKLEKSEGPLEKDERSRRCLTCHHHKPFRRIVEKNGHPIDRPMKTEYTPSKEARLALGRIETDKEGYKDIIVCATCHFNHGIENPDGTVSIFAGGGLPEGKLCVNCHREHGNIVGSPHDFRTRKKPDFQPDGGRSRKHGVCAGCHANHNANIAQGLLAMKIPPPKGKGNPEDMVCLYCHRKPQIMKDRKMVFYVHPSGSEVTAKLKEKNLHFGSRIDENKLGKPTYGSVTGYAAIFRIRCTTCHDNHVWIAPENRGQKNQLNGTETSHSEMSFFLKGSGVAQTLCANCHGLQALYRYRYFHKDRTFTEKVPNE